MIYLSLLPARYMALESCTRSRDIRPASSGALVAIAHFHLILNDAYYHSILFDVGFNSHIQKETRYTVQSGMQISNSDIRNQSTRPWSFYHLHSLIDSKRTNIYLSNRPESESGVGFLGQHGNSLIRVKESCEDSSGHGSYGTPFRGCRI